MDITYIGHSSFKIKGKNVTVITDPYQTAETGLKFPKHSASDIVTVSHAHKDHNATEQIEGEPYIIAGPGEYEVKGVGIVGLPTYHDAEKGQQRGRNTIYRIEVDGVAIVHLGDLGHELSNSDIDHLGTVDILLIPVGGIYTIDAKTAQLIINEIEPGIVIPMHYKTEVHDKKLFEEVLPLEEFLKIMGKIDLTPVSKFAVNKDKIPMETTVVVLEPTN